MVASGPLVEPSGSYSTVQVENALCYTCPAKTRLRICTKSRPMERDFEELQNGTMHSRIECRVKELFKKSNMHSQYECTKLVSSFCPNAVTTSTPRD